MALALKLDSIDALDESIQALYKKQDDDTFILDLDGYQDPTGLKSALEKEREANKASTKELKEIKKRFDGIDPDKVKELLSKMGSDEEARLMAEGKLDEVVANRTEKLKLEYEKLLLEAKTEAETERNKAGQYKDRVLDNNVMAAAIGSGVHKPALEDALIRARNIFSLDEHGNAVQLDQDGAVKYGKDGKSPFTTTEWLEEMKEAAPHWFTAGNSGGGASGNNEQNGNRKTMTRTNFDALAPDEKSNVVKSGVTLTD